MNKNQAALLIIALGLVVTFPYVLGWAVSGKMAFSGFLLNPLDGNTYLAKMNQGWEGNWQFTLPYSSEPGEGAYINLFYLFLGHAARWLGLPVMAVFHAARVIGAGLLAWSLVIFFQKIVFPTQLEWAQKISWLALFGSGMGWLVVLTGEIPSDFWVAETYPFLSSYVNPHFPAGLVILVFILLLAFEERRLWHFPVFVAAGLLEAIILPFGLAVAALALAGWSIWTWIEERPAAALRMFGPMVSILLLGGPFLLYLVWITQTHPVLSGWNAQNLTPSPPWWDFLLSLSPAFVLACLGVVHLWKMKQHPARRLLIAWFVLGGILVYVPFALQRRFLIGYYIPTAALAGFGLDALRRKFQAKWLFSALLGLSVVTNVFLLLGGILGVVGHSEQLFLSADEYRALQWIKRETPASSLVLASPEIGNYIPAVTNRRVIYGHPFETVNAEVEEQRVRDFFGGAWSEAEMKDFLALRRVDYIFWGNRERNLNQRRLPLENLAGLELVHQEGAVFIYAVRGAP